MPPATNAVVVCRESWHAVPCQPFEEEVTAVPRNCGTGEGEGEGKFGNFG